MSTQKEYNHAVVRAFHNDPVGLMGYDLGTGSYGAVYECTAHDRMVVKEFEVADAYPLWAAYSALAYRRGTGRSVLPRVYAMSMPTGDGRGYALLERLDATLAERNSHEHEDFVTTFGVALHDTIRMSESGGVSRRHGERPVGNTKIFDAALAYVTELVIVCANTRIALQSDAHRGNWMLRGDALVLTDPLVLSGVNSAEEGREGILSVVDTLCKQVDMYDPGFYSQYQMKRELI